MGPALGRICGHQAIRSESTPGQSAFVWNTAARLPRTFQLGEGRPVRPIVGSTTIGMKSYVPSSRSIPSSRSEEHTSELQSLAYLVCRLLLEKKKNTKTSARTLA